jgi:hypothetical protein
LVLTLFPRGNAIEAIVQRFKVDSITHGSRLEP